MHGGAEKTGILISALGSPGLVNSDLIFQICTIHTWYINALLLMNLGMEHVTCVWVSSGARD